jgi:N-acetylglucosamine-6-phosphate deacetylase
MEEALKHGYNIMTHLYSGMKGVERRNAYRYAGAVEAGLYFDSYYVEIIADGKHLPIELLRLIFKLKPHDKIILVSDSLKVAGSTEKYSNVGNMPCIIEDGVCKLLDRSAFAGSIATADVLIKKAVEAGLDLSEAVKMGSENPAYLFGLSKGKLDVGYDGDITVFDKDLNVKKVFVKGEISNDN